MADDPNVDTTEPVVDAVTTTDSTADFVAVVTGKDGTTFDPDRAQRTIEKLREELKAAKLTTKERDDLAAKVKEFEDSQKSELEKAQEAAKEARDRAKVATEKARNANLKSALYDKAADLGIGSPSLALKALNRSKIEWDDSDEPSNIEAVLEALLEEEPLLKATPKKKTASTDAGGGAGGGEPPQLSQEQLEAAGLLGYKDPAEYAADMNLKTLADWNKARARSAA